MEFRTARLVLRDFQPDDWRAVLEYQREPDYLRYYAWTSRSEEEVRAFVQMFIDQQAERPRRRFQLAVTLPEDGRLIGNAGIRRKPENQWEADIGYELAPPYWGRGYATEAASTLVAYGFRDLGLHRISSWCIAENTASVRVLERLGLRQEGRLRENEHFKGRWWDTLLWGLLREEWEAAGQPGG